MKPNILFIMADQLRWDYLGCNGHPHIKTPVIDALAKRGVNFTRTFIQAPVCGGSRMSFYTGRYAESHGAGYNGYPLRIDEKTMGDYLRPLGMRVALVGKTHMTVDNEGMARLGIDPNSDVGVQVAQCGFEPYERDDGLHPDQSVDPNLAYNKWLRQLGYRSDNPWHDFANSVEGDNGEVLSGWAMRNVGRPARVKEEHSETAYMTDRAISFIDEADGPWCLHVSYIKPHWPYVAPAPYHDMYSARDVIPANRSDAEKASPHPVVAAFMAHDESVNFSRDEVRELVIPAYMGLISQFDHHVGRLVAHLEKRGIADNTIIVVTSDHGDYLGDHWLGEKDLFHEEIVRIPMIVVDPRPSANATRGSKVDALVEAIDLAPTFLDWAGGEAEPHRLEGRSVAPLARGETPPWRDAAFCDSDFAPRHARRTLGLQPDQARAYMVRTERWKYVFYEEYPPQLFDLVTDPQELTDLVPGGKHESVLIEMEQRLFAWFRSLRSRVGISDAEIERRTGSAKKRGYLFGVW
ncbi:arylsulfatase [Variibacter gotjawalensis]|uniref:Arylsulfatase n=1 Tax=Variibacter gotjawalensis TaxID=1333996 RepID=A0A0S3PPA7_9BRAD|nr:alkaline phosphatase family protein [Variibacter gotjawalensis]NIK48007.1 arylsulfatase A-like enzyme [Variibacter gotjawalensis]RZS49884.1 arylsulfatase A-like enzyme [Variibacter gotjawalensis]BAT57712.1 arylsulfatase [Variibacter gotjawalensis]